jgi:hypothetical protein
MTWPGTRHHLQLRIQTRLRFFEVFFEKLNRIFCKEFAHHPSLSFLRKRISIHQKKSKKEDSREGNENYMLSWPYDIEVDEGGNLWLRQYVSEEEEGYKFDIFSPEGIYLKQVVVPHPIDEIKNGKFYCIARTEEDFRIVKRFRLVSKEI